MYTHMNTRIVHTELCKLYRHKRLTINQPIIKGKKKKKRKRKRKNRNKKNKKRELCKISAV